MPNYFKEDGDAMVIAPYGRTYGGGGYGGGGGEGIFGNCFALIIIGVIIFWLLFSRDGRNDGYGNGNCNGGGYPVYPPYAPYPYPAGGGNCCNSGYDCKIKMTPDMSVCELDKDLWKVDADIWKANCKAIAATKEGTQEVLNKLCDQENQNLRDKLAKAYAKESSMESKFFTEKKFDQIAELIYKTDNQNDKQIAGLYGVIKDLKCDIDHCFPKLPPVWIEGITPNTHHTDCHDFPRQKRGCGGGCNDFDCACN